LLSNKITLQDKITLFDFQLTDKYITRSV
jgi:hypothetical protein